jgi:hypothetical protein
MTGRRRHALTTLLVFIAIMLTGPQFAGLRGPCPGGNGPVLCSMELTEGVKNFYELQRHYQKWNDGFFGSRHYYEGKLILFLRKLVGKEITTEHDFMLASPEGVVDKKMICIFPSYRWLYIHGDLDVESLKNIPGTDYPAMKGWWRSGVLVAVTGKLKKFKIDWDAQGDTVHLYLEKVTVFYEKEKKMVK